MTSAVLGERSAVAWIWEKMDKFNFFKQKVQHKQHLPHFTAETRYEFTGEGARGLQGRCYFSQ
jgi:hypothetical protein